MRGRRCWRSEQGLVAQTPSKRRGWRKDSAVVAASSIQVLSTPIDGCNLTCLLSRRYSCGCHGISNCLPQNGELKPEKPQLSLAVLAEYQNTAIHPLPCPTRTNMRFTTMVASLLFRASDHQSTHGNARGAVSLQPSSPPRHASSHETGTVR